MNTVLLTELEEFLAEAQFDLNRGEVFRAIVRISKAARPVMRGALTAVSVEASYLVMTETDRRELVRFRQRVGDLWGNEEADAKVNARASELVRELEERVADLGFEIRAGIYVTEDPI